MQAIRIHGTTKTIQRLVWLCKQAAREGAYRVARRLHAVVLNMEGRTAPEIAGILKVHRSKVSLWLRHWQQQGMDGMLEGYRSGRPKALSEHQWQTLVDILDSGPVAYGFTSGVWTCPGAALLFEDEATFRQDPPLYQTWARVGCQPQIPTTGQKKSLKVFGTIKLYAARFLYHFQQVFNAQTYLDYLERLLRSYCPRKIHLIQDNASSHKDKEVWDWFSQHRRHIEVHNLPAYSPQFNALERVWHYTRLQATHNRYFVTLAELQSVLTSTFRSIQKAPSQVQGYLHPFQ